MNINRRKFLRLNTDRQQCNVRLGIGESAGFVVDESIEGLRIGGLDLLILFADQKVTVEYDGESIVGRCRSVSRGDGGYFEVGIHREGDDYTEDPKSILLNTFMKFDGKSVTCVPMGVTQDDDVQIKLINGKEFTVSLPTHASRTLGRTLRRRYSGQSDASLSFDGRRECIHQSNSRIGSRIRPPQYVRYPLKANRAP